MNDILSELAAAIASEGPTGAACSCAGGSEDILVSQRVPIGEDGDSFEVEVPAVRCNECGEVFTDERAERARHAGACHHLGLLAPDEVKELRDSREMSRKAFGEAFGIPPASMERWENGRLLQNRSMDTLLRALMIPGVAQALDRRTPPQPAFVDNIIAFPTLARQTPQEFKGALARQALFQLRAHG